MSNKCMVCGKQLHENDRSITCSSCVLLQEKKKCNFCDETKCVAYGDSYFKSIDKKIFVDFRADMEANQIDCAFGILNEDGTPSERVFSDFAIDINYCPVCGRKLPIVE